MLIVLGLVPLNMAAVVSSRAQILTDVTNLSVNDTTSTLAGYNTTRVGPTNANCTRKTYSISYTTHNKVFKPEVQDNDTQVSFLQFVEYSSRLTV